MKILESINQVQIKKIPSVVLSALTSVNPTNRSYTLPWRKRKTAENCDFHIVSRDYIGSFGLKTNKKTNFTHKLFHELLIGLGKIFTNKKKFENPCK